MTNSGQQLSLFDQGPEPEPVKPAPAPLDQARAAKSKTRLNAHTSLANAVEAYHDHIAGSELSPHTVKSFIYDLNILIEFAGATRPIGQIAQRDLRELHGLAGQRARRAVQSQIAVAASGHVEGVLPLAGDSGVIDDDPAAPIAHKPVSTPLPDILTDEQVEEVLAAANNCAIKPRSPMRAPYVLIRCC